MNKIKTIPAGYRLSVASYENDGDAEKTIVLEGLTREGCALRVDLAMILKGDDEFENLFEPSKEEIAKLDEALIKVLLEHGIAEEAHSAEQHAYNLLGSIGLMGGSEYFTRAVETITVEHVIHAVELHDVTEDFLL